MTDDAELLRRYTRENAEDAFAELVRRHIDFVHATALRQARGNSALAADVTQMVFTDLARKAAAHTRHVVLAGWLHTATRYAAAKLIRAETRRQRREHAAQVQEEILRDAPVADWSRLQPVLDDVLGELKERERAAILLRFFEGKRLAEIGTTLALSEDGARSCVDRALEKMRDLLARRGVSSTSAALGVALAQSAGAAAPAGLAASVTGSALSAAAGTGSALVLGGLLTMGKIKIGLVSAVVLAGLATSVGELRATRALKAEQRSLRSTSHDPRPLLRENERLGAEVRRLSENNPEIEELNRVRTRLAALRARPPGIVEAEMKPPANVGRATPVAAFITFCHAMNSGDLDGVAPLMAFHDDTPANRASFMENVSEAVRTRYRTPERLLAAALFGSGLPNDPAVVIQLLSAEEDRPGLVMVRLWIRQASGKESEINDRFQRGPNGWTLRSVGLLDEGVREVVRQRIDPVTGATRPMQL